MILFWEFSTKNFVLKHFPGNFQSGFFFEEFSSKLNLKKKTFCVFFCQKIVNHDFIFKNFLGNFFFFFAFKCIIIRINYHFKNQYRNRSKTDVAALVSKLRPPVQRMVGCNFSVFPQNHEWNSEFFLLNAQKV